MSLDVKALDETKLARWLEANLPGFRGPLTSKKFGDGQSNPTFLIEAASGAYVLRRKPPGLLLKSAHAVDREFRVQKALAGSGVPVARMDLLCEDDEVIGSAFYIMERVPGRIFWDPALPGLTNAERTAIFDEMNKALAHLHSTDPAKVGLSDFGRPGSYFSRQFKRYFGITPSEVRTQASDARGRKFVEETGVVMGLPSALRLNPELDLPRG